MSEAGRGVAMSAKTRYTEGELAKRLAARYAPPAWAFLPHVANGTGWRRDRTVDGVALSLWPSRGIHLHAFEIKTLRSDWLREWKKPAKADAFVAHCHAFWIVAAPGVVVPGELPPTWGLLGVHGAGLAVEREAPLQTVPPLPWAMLAALLRRAAEQQGDPLLQGALAPYLDRRGELVEVRLDQADAALHVHALGPGRHEHWRVSFPYALRLCGEGSRFLVEGLQEVPGRGYYRWRGRIWRVEDGKVTAEVTPRRKGKDRP